ncbi:MAG TPA: sigma-70 family RNA polymerase sigma factor [Paludibacteraceae bacterium]|nr:sigma-70 family RNA polymerase sigma factor [Paludibacteraceae bacterium]OPZ01932.1 MAG: ECF RNA polymerase sigma factor SigW [Bacteroidetes bacterium ADurb.BinA395]HOF99409.1 sigma-70 family RNA polymerase sigma factor [Paludibacteraceae bacterium]HOJ66255.1 sigma-70 family RNA polymerase sigma factor [Paludibacteraceae bacterium]HOL30181.1 sigma-70 family RNA polymerase sigma factor [Paludibacteraceae bacterium]
MDAAQFNSVILPLADQLFRVAKSIVCNDEAAKDAVQELNAKLWENRSQLDKVQNLTAFAMKSMRNLCLDWLRTRKSDYDVPLDENLIASAPNPHQLMEQKDLTNYVKQLIDKLPELQRTIIHLRDVEGLEISEIAAITSISENAISVNLSRARQKLRTELMEKSKKEKI